MAGSTSEDYGVSAGSSSVDGSSSLQPTDSLGEWRSCDPPENEPPSTPAPYWDSDDDYDAGPKPSELYGKFTWNIEKFSQISKRELRSNAFEVGGYKWYILIYPQGCDVCNHLSLFLCVANHDKLLPGWSHFAQFTISVVNKDPKQSKYSDTLHRFWKKEHDWGWKKFMELSKVLDGFITNDTLTIKAQVQVIREKAHRPFRCLDCQYRRELIRVYLSNVEQICRRFVEERKQKFSKLLEDKVKWSSFRAFWIGINQNVRQHMLREKMDTILKEVVKHFFIEKEVTSTLVMDSLYSGLRALECQSKNKKGRAKLLEMEESPSPMVHVEKDMFVLADDMFLLLERAALEPLPHQPSQPKDGKGLQARTKEGCLGDESNRGSSERDERRLTEFGRRAVEIFVLSHIFSRIEVAYQEAVALKRQEELIREEEAAGLAENEHKGKRGASEKEKKTKKKQAKQKRGNRKGKDRTRDEKYDAMVHGKEQVTNSDDNILEDFTAKLVQEKIDTTGDVSDVSDTGDDGLEAHQPDLEDRDTSPLSWDTDTSEVNPVIEASSSEVQNGQMEKKSPSFMDDSSSTCSTDSVPSIVVNGPYKGNSSPSNKSQTSSNRVKNQRSMDMRTGSSHCGNNIPSDVVSDAARLSDATFSCKPTETEPETDVLFLKDRVELLEHQVVKKGEVATLQNHLSFKDIENIDSISKSKTAEPPIPSSSPSKKKPLSVKHSSQNISSVAITSTAEPGLARIPSELEKAVPLPARSHQTPSILKTDIPRQTIQPRSTTSTAQAAHVSRPLSAPIIPCPKPAAATISTAQTMPLLSRSASSIGRLGSDPCASAQSFVPQSYRNAIMGKTSSSSAAFTSQPSLSTSCQTATFSHPSSLATSSSHMVSPLIAPRKDQSSVNPGFSIRPVMSEASSSSLFDSHPHASSSTRLANNYEAISNVSLSRQAQGTISDEFPHLDIINDLLDEDHIVGRATLNGYHNHLDYHAMSRQYTFPRDSATTNVGSLGGLSQYNQSEQYYDEGFQSTYGSSGVPFHLLRESQPLQVDLLSAYGTGQWPLGSAADLSMLNLDGSVHDVNGYPYQFQEYSNLTSCVNGFGMMYRPANGL